MPVSADVLAKDNRIEVKRLARAAFAPAGASPFRVAADKLRVLETLRFRAEEIVRLPPDPAFPKTKSNIR